MSNCEGLVRACQSQNAQSEHVRLLPPKELKGIVVLGIPDLYLYLPGLMG